MYIFPRILFEKVSLVLITLKTKETKNIVQTSDVPKFYLCSASKLRRPSRFFKTTQSNLKHYVYTHRI